MIRRVGTGMAAEFICSNCGHLGHEKQITKGSFGIELILWLCFLIPGLIYSLWRLSSRHSACAHCQAPNLVPVNSPRGMQLATQFHPTLSREQLEGTDYKGNAAKGRVYLAIIAVFIIVLIYLTTL